MWLSKLGECGFKERKKRGPYKTYDDVTRLKIAKYSCHRWEEDDF